MGDTFLGRTLAHYEILEKLGQGGMGVVYKARDTHLDRFVAIKVLPPAKVADPDRKRRFVQEAKAASALNHPNIITIHDIAAEAGADFIVMELVAGRALDALVGRRGLKLGETLKYTVQIADALATAHEAGIVHRDLKPSNVMVTEKGLVKVLDFGLAKLTEAVNPDQAATLTLKPEPGPLTDEGAVLGTVAYMSPEQAEAKKVDPRSDIFSFGSLLYEMVTGHRAFAGDSKMSTITAILRDDPKPLGDAADPVPRDLEKIIHRCLRKDPDRRFQHMADVKVALEELKEESESGRLVVATPSPPRRRLPLAPVALILAALALATAGLWWRLRQPNTGGAPGLTVRQLTQDTGLTAYPAISPDGKLLAYASDRAGDGNLDIWVQQLSRGAQPVRLTRHPAEESSPSFSPDGGQIVFWSARDGGGLYVIPALGGEEGLLLRGRFSGPGFSPDGLSIATSAPGGFQASLLVMPAAGGSPRRLAEAFYAASSPVWSPDGKRILFRGQVEMGGELDWWVVPVDGGPPVRTGAATVLRGQGVGGLPEPAEWLGNRILYSTGNLWRLPLSAGLFQAGQPERLTTGSGNESHPRAIASADGKDGAWRIAFASTQLSVGLWSLPLDLNAAKLLGEPVKLISDGLRRITPSLSADGRRLAYVFRGLDNFGVRVRDLPSGAETTVLQAPNDLRARISPDGTVVAYNLSAQNEKETVIYLVSSSGGDSRKLCDTCGMIYGWAPDGKRIIYRSGNPMRFSTVEVATGRQTVILAHPKLQVHAAVYSPDGRWLAMHFAPFDGPRSLFVLPAHDGVAGPESEWIPIMGRLGTHSRPVWSPDGNVLYFFSTAEGETSLWRQRLDPATKRPLGDPVVAYRPQGQRLRITVAGHYLGPGEGKDRLVIPLSEASGNIWIAE